MKGSAYRTDIDAIKGLAIIAVVFYHMGFLTSGYLGVDSFFVINGFFILPVVFRLFDGNGLNGLLAFWEKRIMRLWPLMLVATSFCLLVGYWGLLPDNYENLSESVIATNLFSYNILSAITTANYWDISNDYNPLMHMWYVGILVQFYIVTPLILWCISKLAKWRRLDFKKLGQYTIIILATLSFLFYLSPLSEGPGRFYYLPARFWELALGGIIALFICKIQNRKCFENTGVNSSVTILLLMIICIGLIWPNHMHVPALVITASASAYLLAANPSKNMFDKILTWSPLCVIGKMSFSIFVWHQILLAFYRYYITDELSPLFVLCFWAVTLLVSGLSYLLIEQKVKVSHRTFATAACSMVLLAIPSAAIYLHAGVVRDVPEMNVYFDNVHRGMHAEYVDRVYAMDREFVNDGRINVLVVGNSFARDWVNVLLESQYKDNLDITYAYEYRRDLISRIRKCDYLFSRIIKSEIPSYVWENISNDKVWGIGTKTFGNSNGVIYARRNKDDYYESTITPNRDFIQTRAKEMTEWGGHYIDMMKPAMDADGNIKVFTPNHKFISHDCTHLSEDGAKYYAEIFDLDRIFKQE